LPGTGWLIPNIKYLDVWKKVNKHMASLLHQYTVRDNNEDKKNTLMKYYGLTEEDINELYGFIEDTTEMDANLGKCGTTFDEWHKAEIYA
jgi:hypothetical protein